MYNAGVFIRLNISFGAGWNSRQAVKAKRRPSPRPDDATFVVRHGGSGVILEPTVIVCMGEGKRLIARRLTHAPHFVGFLFVGEQPDGVRVPPSLCPVIKSCKEFCDFWMPSRRG